MLPRGVRISAGGRFFDYRLRLAAMVGRKGKGGRGKEESRMFLRAVVAQPPIRHQLGAITHPIDTAAGFSAKNRRLSSPPSATDHTSRSQSFRQLMERPAGSRGRR